MNPFLLKLFAPGLLFYLDDLSSKEAYFMGSFGVGPNLFLRLLILILVISFLSSLIFYVLGRYYNLKENYQWFITFAIGLAAYTFLGFLFISEYIWQNEDLIGLTKDIDYAFVISPILWLFVFYTLFSKIWMSLPDLTVFSKYTPSFLSKK